MYLILGKIGKLVWISAVHQINTKCVDLRGDGGELPLGHGILEKQDTEVPVACGAQACEGDELPSCSLVEVSAMVLRRRLPPSVRVSQ